MNGFMFALLLVAAAALIFGLWPNIQHTLAHAPAGQAAQGPPPGGPIPPPSQLAQMSLSQLVEVLGLSKVMKVDDTFGNTIDRIIIIMAWVLLSGYLSLVAGLFAASFITSSLTAGYLVSFALWILILGGTLRYFLVYVREDTAFIAVEAISGTQHVFLTGLDVKYPTESVHKRNFVDLTMREISEYVTYNTKDGARYSYTYLLLYRPSVNRLPIYRAVNEEDIVREVQAIVRSALSLATLQKLSDELNEGNVASGLEKELLTKLGQGNDDWGHQLEYRFGIDIVNISLSEPTPHDDLIEARQAEIIAKKVRSTADELRKGDPTLSSQEAMNAALMLNKEDISKTVHSYELGAIPKIIGDAVDKAVNAFVNRPASGENRS